MEIVIKKNHVKAGIAVLAAAALLFSTATSVLYWRWRQAADQVFAVMEFDIQSRRDEIVKRYNELRQQQQQQQAQTEEKK